MDDLQQRKYYRIFSGTNQSGGYENIHLGYEANTTEINLKKDTFNYLHVPFFTNVSDLTASTLLADGAEAGVIPAASDRIFKKQGNYGTHTNWGHNTGVQDGTWLCSWFRSVSGEAPAWYDRYYDPAKLTYEQALQGQTTFTTPYTALDPAFEDRPSGMTLEPGVLYQYFHMGEKTSQEFVETFSGDNKDKLRLRIDSYTSTITDSSLYGNRGVIENFKSVWSGYETDSNYISGNYLDFNNPDFINARVFYNDSYNVTDQFTFNLFVRHNNWSNATSSQLAGNMFESGYGLFYNNLNYYPYFVIPENTYGHLFFLNQERKPFVDQTTTTTGNVSSSNPKQVSLNGERDVIVLNDIIDTQGNISSSMLMKVNHTGDNMVRPIEFYDKVGKQFIIDQNNNVILYTTNGVYTYDEDLNLIKTDSSTSYQNKQQIAFDKLGNLKIKYNADAFIFDNNNNEWVVKDGSIRVNDVYNSEAILALPTNVTKIAVDPNGNVWLLHDVNKVSIVNPDTLTVTKTFTLGKLHSDEPMERNLSFIKIYNRSSNTQTWHAVFYYNYDKIVYVTTLEGAVVDVIFLYTALDPTYKQDPTRMTFTGEGDFTGYEWSRINNNLVYNNNPQVQFKIATTDHIYGNPTKTYTVSVPAQYFRNNIWYLITGVYDNHTMKLYIDTVLRDSLPIPGSRDITYKRKNDFFIGCPNGKATNLNKEINSKSVIFNGQIDTIRVYNYAIKPNLMQYFLKARVKGQDITWNIPTANLQYIEVIERFFKHKMPGAKSQFFKIKLSGIQIKDLNTRAIIEEYIKSLIEQTKPAYTELLSIEWVE